MAAVLAVTTVRAHDGKFADLMTMIGKLKPIIERAGGQYRVSTQLYGSAPTTITTVVETAGWAEFGALSAKLEADGDYQAIIASARANPTADIVARGVSTAVAV